MIPHTVDMLPARSPLGAGCVGAIVLAQAGAIFGAVCGWPVVFTVAVVVGIAADVVSNNIPSVRILFSRAQIGLIQRSLVRELGLVVLVARSADLSRGMYLAVALAAVASPLARGALMFLQTPLNRRIQRPVTVLNVPLAALGPQPKEVPMPPVTGAVLLTAPPLVAGCFGAITGHWWPFLVLTALALAVIAGLGGWAVRALLGARGVAPRTAYLNHVRRAVQKIGPEAVLYFSGPSDAIYQVNMWLRVMERIGHPVLVVLRERRNLELLADTSLPVVVIPNATDLMNFRMPTVRVAFYVAHVGKNIHLQREPRMKHVFIGHGESDKVASVNPITKGFDEVWVAGRVSRERWAAARVGVRDDAIVEVGRPQLGGIEKAAVRRDRPLSVLYAPTWEGWTNDLFASSVPTMGPAMVRWLVGRPDTRVIYKPHPFTGSVSAEARAANQQIIELVTASPRHGELKASASGWDWSAVEDRDLVLTSGRPGLYDCFNHADVLIGDISSVVPDFLASGKPYAVPNPAARPHAAVRAELASTRAAYLLDPDGRDWEDLLLDAETTDSLAPTRAELRQNLLGPWHADPVDPWRAALTRLIDTANAEWPEALREAAVRPE